MSERTPGPWEASELGVIAEHCTTHGNFYVCSLIDPDCNEDKANAMLIAAAPELLKALEDMLAYVESVSDIEQHEIPSVGPLGLVLQARSAIAKAEGK